jgi:hypothetical protein
MCAIVCNNRLVYDTDFWYPPTYIQPPLRILLTSQICNFITNHYLLVATSSITLSNFPHIKCFVNIYFFGNFKLMSILFFSSPRLYLSNHPLTKSTFKSLLSHFPRFIWDTINPLSQARLISQYSVHDILLIFCSEVCLISLYFWLNILFPTLALIFYVFHQTHSKLTLSNSSLILLAQIPNFIPTMSHLQ